jgi:hypothetical protein
VFGNGPIMSNVYGDGTISIYSENTNPLYRVAARISDNALYVDVVRDTDYFKILQNDAGMFLNSIRVGNPDDKLIAALDRATTMAELESIMSRTVRMNPIRMMDAVRTFNMFEMIDVATLSDGVSVAPIFLYSDDFNASGVGADVSFDISRNLKIAASVYAATMDFTNDLDEYKIDHAGKYMPAYIQGKFYTHPLMYNLYGLNFNKQAIQKNHLAILAEGEKSSLIADGWYGDNNCVVATCGDKFNKFLVKQLVKLGVTDIIVAYDRMNHDKISQKIYFNKLYSMCQK